MNFLPTLRFFHKNNARNIAYMAVLIFPKNLDLRKNAYSRTALTATIYVTCRGVNFESTK